MKIQIYQKGGIIMKYYKKIDEYRRPAKIVGAILLSVILVLLVVGAIKFLDRKKADNRDGVSAPVVTNGVVTDWGNTIDIVIRNRYIGGKVKTTRIDISKMSYTARQPNTYTETVKLPASIEEIAKDSFDFFYALKSIKVSIFNKHFKSVDGVLYSKDGKILIRYPVDKDGESFSIPNGVEVIAYNAFCDNANLKTVNIPSSVTVIEEGAFKGCTSLDNIVIPDSVTSIGDFAFSRCEGLVHINLSRNLKSIGNQTFSHSTALKSIILPDSLKNFGEDTFLGCWALSEVVFPDGIEEIPYGMFASCRSLTDFTVPSTVKRISEMAFDGAGLQKITFSEGLEVIGWLAFEECASLKEIVIPKSVRSIDGEAFQNCPSLEKITFLGGDVRLGGGAFDGCKKIKSVYVPSLEDWLSITFENQGSNPLEFGAKLYFGDELVTDVEIPDGTKVVGAYQFSGYSYLESVKLPEGLEKIDMSAFKKCTSLKEIFLPENLTLIYISAFSECKSLESVYVPSLEFWLELKTYDGISPNVKNFYIDGKRTTDVVIPEGTEVINSYTFCNWTFLESIYIPASVTAIGHNGLVGCSSLSQIYFGGTLEEWNELISRSPYWKQWSDYYTVYCLDGEIQY